MKHSFCFLKKIIVLFALLISSMIANSQAWGVIDSLRIIPSNPIPGDTVKVICKSHFASSYCPLINSSVTIVGNNISVYSSHYQGGLMTFCYSTDTIALGNFDVGNYCLTYFLLDSVNNIFDTDSICFSILPNLITSHDNESSVTFYPNPIKDYCIFSISRYENNLVYEFELFELNGKSIFKDKIRNSDYTFFRKNFPIGIYFFSIRKNESTIFRGIMQFI